MCGLCSFYVDAGLWERIINDKYIPNKEQQPKPPKTETLITLAAKNFFGFNNFREEQMEAIVAYLGSTNTFVSIKTGGVKLYATPYLPFVLKVLLLFLVLSRH